MRSALMRNMHSTGQSKIARPTMMPTTMRLLFRLANALGGGEHFRDRVHIFGLHLSHGNALVGEVFEFQQEIDQRHGVDESGGNERSVFVDRDARRADQGHDVRNHLLGFCHHSRYSYDSTLSLGCSRNNFSRVAERAGFPAVLLTIHFGGLRKMVRTAMPRVATTWLRISRSSSPALDSNSSRSNSATTTMSSVPRSAL